jgi:hypothetical protein
MWAEFVFGLIAGGLFSIGEKRPDYPDSIIPGDEAGVRRYMEFINYIWIIFLITSFAPLVRQRNAGRGAAAPDAQDRVARVARHRSSSAGKHIDPGFPYRALYRHSGFRGCCAHQDDG